MTNNIERLKFCMKSGTIEAGCDEAGRGCLAGPVFAAAVILPDDFDCTELNDSKQMTVKQRSELKCIMLCCCIMFTRRD